MTGRGRSDVTMLLQTIRAGDDSAKGELFELVYAELQQIAAGLMRSERVDHTLQATALVNEAAIRLLGDVNLAGLENRAHFYGAAAQAMRRILVDHARLHATQKRGGGRVRVPLSNNLRIEQPAGVDDEVWLDDALHKLEELNPRQAQVLVLRRYGGLSNGEIAELLGVSLRTVEADLTTAKAWLYGEIKESSCG